MGLRRARRARALVDAVTRLEVWPHWLHRQLDPSSPSFVPRVDRAFPANVTGRNWTTVGNLDSSRGAVVDPAGLVTPTPGGWSLDWWIGADDRWHLPSREAAVRQRLVDDAPVVETAMRVPGGDVLHRVFAVRDGDEEVVVVEVENATPVPVALAFAVRPYGPEGLAPVGRIGLQGTTVTVDGRVALRLSKPPNRVAGSTGSEGDVAGVVLRGEAGTSFPGDLRCDAGLATAAFVVPLPHSATARVVLPLVAGPGGRPPGSLPPAVTVARGWRAHVEQGVRVELPDARLASCVAANRAFLLLLAGRGDPRVLGALDLYGHTVIAPAEAHATAERQDEGKAVAATDAVAVFDDVGHTGLSPALTLRLALAELEAGDRRALDRLGWLLDAATPTWTWPEAIHPRLPGGSAGDGHDAGTAADLVRFVRNLLVRETADGLALCTLLPDGWRGGKLEVHDAPTRVGRLSFAVRWHGDRPAVLWELVPHDGVGPVRLTAPGLDPTWSSTELQGDALLGPVGAGVIGDAGTFS